MTRTPTSIALSLALAAALAAAPTPAAAYGASDGGWARQAGRTSPVVGVPMVSVGILLHQSAVLLSATGPFALHDGRTGQVRETFARGRSVRLTRAPDGVRYRPDASASSLILAPGPGAFVLVNGRPYRGRIDVQTDDRGALNVVNVLDVESYLYGVVRAEMPANSPFEALKAQAIASRTYALKNRDSFREQGFGLKASEQSQVYGGVGDEDARTTAAVDETRGIVLAHQGQLVEASFHASCGGQTENNEDVWAVGPLPYQRAVACTGCRRDPPEDWSVKLDLNMVATRLRKAGFAVGKIRGIWAVPSRTGRVREIVVQSDRGTVRVPGNQFRLSVDRKTIKSLMWNLHAIAVASAAPSETASDGASPVQALSVSGRGHGHGLGMCQHGAIVVAGLGTSSWDILRGYYPGVEFGRAY